MHEIAKECQKEKVEWWAPAINIEFRERPLVVGAEPSNTTRSLVVVLSALKTQ